MSECVSVYVSVWCVCVNVCGVCVWCVCVCVRVVCVFVVCDVWCGVCVCVCVRVWNLVPHNSGRKGAEIMEGRALRKILQPKKQ